MSGRPGKGSDGDGGGGRWRTIVVRVADRAEGIQGGAVIVGGGDGEGGCLGAVDGGAVIGGEGEYLGLVLGSAWCRAGVALDHALGREEGLYLLAEVEDVAVLLGDVRTGRGAGRACLRAATRGALRRSRDTGDGDGRRWRNCRRPPSARRTSVGGSGGAWRGRGRGTLTLRRILQV